MAVFNEAVSDAPRFGRRTRFFAVGGGKGGSGKSFIAANLGVNLTRRGRSVIMVDTDLGGANLHTLLGLSLHRAPRWMISSTGGSKACVT